MSGSSKQSCWGDLGEAGSAPLTAGERDVEEEVMKQLVVLAQEQARHLKTIRKDQVQHSKAMLTHLNMIEVMKQLANQSQA